ncbi:hypothetical protein BDA99DRAFT_492077, partial [Phascolomyces articulosus]
MVCDISNQYASKASNPLLPFLLFLFHFWFSLLANNNNSNNYITYPYKYDPLEEKIGITMVTALMNCGPCKKNKYIFM